METVLLLRSFGDFVISLYHLSDETSHHRSIQLVASRHLEPLHQSLFPFLTPAQQSVKFIDIGIEHQILSGFTDRYFFSKENIEELRNLKKQINGIGHLVLEQKRKAWLIKMVFMKAFSIVHKQGNIYDSWGAFYGNSTENVKHKVRPKKVLIFPDSRLRRKEIPEKVLLQLEQQLELAGIISNRAYFKTALVGSSYQNFTELVNLVAGSEFIISSDSLPAHIAQLLHKPHAILYANQINHEWITPYVREHATSFTFDEVYKFVV
jgi:hypothetical protein